jgi:NADPH:quinone reductase-like Zn-dependent oxidoreductase
MIRRGRYPDFKGPLPFTPGYEIVGVVEKIGAGVVAPFEGERVADLFVVGGYAQYAIRATRSLVPVPDSIDPAEAVCIPLAYLTAFQMLTRCRSLRSGATILVIGASGTVGTALLDLARHLGLKAIGTCSAAHLPVIERFGAAAIDYRFVASVRQLTPGGAGVDIAFDAIWRCGPSECWSEDGATAEKEAQCAPQLELANPGPTESGPRDLSPHADRDKLAASKYSRNCSRSRPLACHALL